MKSTIRISRSRAIEFNADLVAAIEKLTEEFAALSVRDLLTAARLSPADVPDADAADALYERTKNYEHRSLANEIRSARRYAWDVQLRSGQWLRGITSAELLALPNAADRSVQTAAWGHAGYGDGLTLDFDKRSGPASTIEVKGEAGTVADFARRAVETLQPYERMWWPLRSTVVVFSLAAVCGLAVAHWLYTTTAPRMTDPPDPLNAYAFIAAVVFGLICNPVTELGWRWAFPMVEFVFGKGAKEAGPRGAVRKFLLWSLPVTGFGIPILRGILS